MRNIRRIIVHRIKVDHVGFPDSADGVSAFFARHPDGLRVSPRGVNPYHYIIEKCGKTVQCNLLREQTGHAYGHNSDSIGVGVYGDFRNDRPTFQQGAALVHLCAQLMAIYTRLKIFRHGDLPRPKDKGRKVCPGRHLNVEAAAEAARLVCSLADLQG